MSCPGAADAGRWSLCAASPGRGGWKPAEPPLRERIAKTGAGCARALREKCSVLLAHRVRAAVQRSLTFHFAPGAEASGMRGRWAPREASGTPGSAALEMREPWE